MTLKFVSSTRIFLWDSALVKPTAYPASLTDISDSACFLPLLIYSFPLSPILISGNIIHQPSCSSKNLYVLWFFSLPCSLFYPEANPDLYATKIYLKSTHVSLSLLLSHQFMTLRFLTCTTAVSCKAVSPFLLHTIQSPHRGPSIPFKIWIKSCYFSA